MNANPSIRQKLGAAVLDWPPFELRLRNSWTHIRNRDESLAPAPRGQGVACNWRWTSDLHVAKVFPALGARLMRRCLLDWPIEFAEEFRPSREIPGVSFVIGHRGRERIPLLLATISTIAAQQGIDCECIVVEQSDSMDARPLLPHWVRHVHTPLPHADLPFCRAWALNVGARLARGKVLVFHDNDMLVPSAYAAELWARHEEGFEAVNLKRFVFYLADGHSRRIEAAGRIHADEAPEAVVQNLEAGGSVSMTKRTFLEIGGFDESFVGWGGEDNELWERAVTRTHWPYAYLPIIHLHHAAQPRKADPGNANTLRQAALSQTDARTRSMELSARAFGNPDGLSVPWRSGSRISLPRAT